MEIKQHNNIGVSLSLTLSKPRKIVSNITKKRWNSGMAGWHSPTPSTSTAGSSTVDNTVLDNVDSSTY